MPKHTIEHAFDDVRTIFIVAGWRLTWRVAARWAPGGSPSGASETVIRATSVAALRAAVMAARQIVLIDSYRYWSIREWDDADDPSSCPTCGTRWVPVEVYEQDCTCGGHRRWEHLGRACPPVVLPPYGPGCGELPRQPDPLLGAGDWRPVRRQPRRHGR
ncbi:hypothetical protein [Actinoplanes sp. NPDC051859]|uniref:hypothetical protein n=1 Tax=Actinoplanes sp. NPDC051859 TaxID=3363909 RepID=UPI0037B27956